MISVLFAKKTAKTWLGGLALLLIVAGVLGQHYQQTLLTWLTHTPPTTRITPPPCNLNDGPCPLPLFTPVASEDPWTLSITPHPIRVNTPLTVTLTPPEQTATLHSPQAVWVDLTGDSMDMGLIRIPLQQNTKGQWVGAGSIPICITGTMQWRTQLYVMLDHTTLQADWIFIANDAALRH